MLELHWQQEVITVSTLSHQPVLIATSLVNSNRRLTTPHRIVIPLLITKKPDMGDYVHNFNCCAKFGGKPFIGASRKMTNV